MLSYEDFDASRKGFTKLLKNIKSEESKKSQNRALLNNYIYTCQQAISAALDALPAKKSNTARKLNGDLFERFKGYTIKLNPLDGVYYFDIRSNMNTTRAY